jgi:hypothetical protein
MPAVSSVTLSDQPNPRLADAAVPPSNRRRALEDNAFPRQLGEARRTHAFVGR